MTLKSRSARRSRTTAAQATKPLSRAISFSLSAILACRQAWTARCIDWKLGGCVGLPSPVSGEGKSQTSRSTTRSRSSQPPCAFFCNLATVSIPLNQCSPNLVCLVLLMQTQEESGIYYENVCSKYYVTQHQSSTLASTCSDHSSCRFDMCFFQSVLKQLIGVHRMEFPRVVARFPCAAFALS